MRVLFSIASYKLGGAERQAVLLAKWLKEKGHDIIFTSFSAGGPVADELSGLHIEAHNKEFDFFFIDNFKSAGFNRQTFSFKRKEKQLQKDYAAYLNSFRPDILMPYTFYPNVSCAGAFPYTNAKACIWNQRDINVDGMRGYHAEKKASENCSWFVSNSTQGIRRVQEIYSVPGAKTSVIGNGILLPDMPGNGLEPYSSEYFSLGAVKVVMLGNFQPNKDHETIIRAWSIVNKALPEKEKQLVLAGRFSGREQIFFSLTESLGMQVMKDVVFLDSVKEVYRLLQTCHIGALSSREEGSPNAVLESMACGLPVVASDIPGCREALGENYPFLSAAGSAESMAEKIIELISQPELAKRTGKNNFERVKNEFSIEKSGNAYLQIFQKFV